MIMQSVTTKIKEIYKAIMAKKKSARKPKQPKKVVEKPVHVIKSIEDEPIQQYSAVVYDDISKKEIKVSFDPNKNIDDELVAKHGFVRDLITDFDRNNDKTVLELEKFEGSEITEKELFGKVYDQVPMSECAKLTLVDDIGIPFNKWIPKELRNFMIKKYNFVDDEGYVCYDGLLDDREPIKNSDFKNFLKDNFIVITGMTPVVEDLKDAPVVNMKEVTKAIEMDNSIMMRSSMSSAIEKAVNIDFVVKYHDEGVVYTKYANNGEVYKHYLGYFSGKTNNEFALTSYYIPNLQEFVAWYSTATKDIMMLSDINPMNPTDLNDEEFRSNFISTTLKNYV